MSFQKQRKTAGKGYVYALTVLSGVLGVACGGSSPPPEEAPPPAFDDEAEPQGGAVAAASSSDVQAGIDAIQAEDFVKAKEILQAAHDKAPSDAQAAFYLGVAQENTEDVDSAITSYRAALKNDPKLTEASVNLSAVLLDRKDYPGALEVAEAGLSAAPKHPSLLTNKAMALAASGKTAEAEPAYKAAVAAAPDAFELRYEYAQLLVQAEKKAEAIDELKQVIQSPDPAVAGAAANLLGRLGAFAECIAGLDRALKAKANPDLYVRRGACRHGMNDEAGALKDYQAAVEADSNFAPGHYYLGRHYLATGKKKEAKTHLAKAAELGAGTPLEAAAKKALAEIK
jgi:tetratricopeptide (TPR) repeat protein